MPVEHGDREAFVDRAGRGSGYRGIIHVKYGAGPVGLLPAGNRSVLGGEYKKVAAKIGGGTVENNSRRRCRRRAVHRRRDRHDERHLLIADRDGKGLAGAVIERRYAGVVVGNPKRRRTLHQAPCVEQVLVAKFALQRLARGNEIGLRVKRSLGLGRVDWWHLRQRARGGGERDNACPHQCQYFTVHCLLHI